jgi:DNA-binding NarL/FixJ family response regulator
MIRLFTIEDHPVIITGLRNLFRPSRDGIEIVGSANHVDEAILKADPETFDIFLLDLWIPSSHPLQNVKRIEEKFPNKPIVIFTSEESMIWQRKMFEAGVVAYLLKNADKSEIKSTLEKVAKGLTIFSGIIETPEDDKFRTVFTDPKYTLTDKQREVVVMLSNGFNQQAIAEKTGTSISNVEKTLKNIREKCHAKSNVELVKILIERSIL